MMGVFLVSRASVLQVAAVATRGLGFFLAEIFNHCSRAGLFETRDKFHQCDGAGVEFRVGLQVLLGLPSEFACSLLLGPALLTDRIEIRISSGRGLRVSAASFRRKRSPLRFRIALGAILRARAPCICSWRCSCSCSCSWSWSWSW